MNIDDVTASAEVPADVFAGIFSRQQELMQKYEEIESRNGVIKPKPIWFDDVPHQVANRPGYNVDDKVTQIAIKDMFWRATEELAEAMEDETVTLGHMSGFRTSQPDNVRHVYEEICDALHFIVEGSIYANIDADQVRHVFQMTKDDAVNSEKIAMTRRDFEVFVWNVVRAMGLAANALKNKPWKQTQMMTDTGRFQMLMHDVWDAVSVLFLQIRLSEADMFLLYHKKNTVNQFRQRSQY